MDQSLVIGIAGGTGSGKTTLMRALVEKFGDSITVISHDNYYKAHDEMSFEQRCQLNYDHPESLETDLLIEHLKQLRQGRTVAGPVYDYAVHNRSEQTLELAARDVIVVEGILLFENKELCSLMDVKIFVDTDADVRLARRMKRDVKKRGRSLESVMTQYLTTVKPMHEQFVEPSKKNADLVVLEGGKNQVARELIFLYIENRLAQARELAGAK